MNTVSQTRIRLGLHTTIGLVLFLSVLTSLTARAIGAETRPNFKTSIGTDLLAQVEKELAKLNEQAEREPGPEWPRPSARVAYLLLAGLAAQGSLLEGLPESEQQFFGIEKGGGVRARLFEVTPDARVALVDRWLNDKAGSILVRYAKLYVRQDGKWATKGGGTAIANE